MAEKYEDAKRQSVEYLNQLRSDIKRLKHQKNRFRNKNIYWRGKGERGTDITNNP